MDAESLRRDALAIWEAGLAAVDSERLVARAVTRDGDQLDIAGHRVNLRRLGRLVVVGAGKAGAGMAAAFERAVGEDVLASDSRLVGWVNVPADCVRPLRRITLHPARPAGVNEPTEDGVAGAERMLGLVGGLGPDDVCVVLLSGGGSALLPAPVEGVTLADKQAVTRYLMHAGASIGELNTVRKQLSRIKGGGLARACTAGLTVALVISDVVGDPLDVIASGPTVPDPSTPADALAVLTRFDPQRRHVPPAIWQTLAARARRDRDPPASSEPPPGVHNHVIGSNRVALEAAAERARTLGYAVHSLGSDNTGVAREVGCELARLARRIRDEQQPLAAPACVLSGGEPVVHLAETDRPRKGGRNQELALAALVELWGDRAKGLAVLSGGTDGEDGPTDAAGALVDAEVIQAARELNLDPREFLAVNNSYPFFERTGGLIRTGPTHTNVMDLRVALVRTTASER